MGRDAREPSMRGLSQITFLTPLQTVVHGFDVYFQINYFPKMFSVVRIQRNAKFLVFLTFAALLFFTISIDEMKLAFQMRQVIINSILILSVSGFQGKEKGEMTTK